MSKDIQIFAYGVDIDYGRTLLSFPEAAVTATAWLKDHELAFWDNGGATIRPCKGAEVQGIILSVPKEFEADLDDIKYYPSLKKKKTVTVEDTLTGKPMQATVYYTGECYLSPFPPSAERFGRMVDGYWRQGLDTKPLFHALTKANEDLIRMHNRQIQKPAHRSGKPKGRDR